MTNVLFSIGSSIPLINSKLKGIQVFFFNHCYKELSNKHKSSFMCLVMLLNQTLGYGRLICSFLGLLKSQNLIWKSEAWVLETDFINNTYIVLGMLFNFSGFDYFMCKKGIFCLSHKIAESASYNILCKITLKNLQIRSLVSDSLQPLGLQHTRLPYTSLTPGAHSNSFPLSQ